MSYSLSPPPASVGRWVLDKVGRWINSDNITILWVGHIPAEENAWQIWAEMVDGTTVELDGRWTSEADAKALLQNLVSRNSLSPGVAW